MQRFAGCTPTAVMAVALGPPPRSVHGFYYRGLLYRRMNDVRLEEALSASRVTVSASAAVPDAATALREHDATAAVVQRAGDLAGVFTADAVVDAVADGHGLDSVTVADVMADTPVSLSVDATVADAIDAMARTGDGCVLVVDADAEAIGVASAQAIAALAATNDQRRGSRPPLGGPDRTPVGASGGAPGDPPGSRDGDPTTAGANTYSEQGVCERCGGLAAALGRVNGRLLCTECRSL
ncbi:CBS domain-containing protein [Halobacterium salinarum]|nr:CBS domain-containing protein [Halobacterium salinarum]MCF2168096.1 CBS domain-containing protein [Halobacterium salinarum]MCF2238278.1 CBS domain-containing protein [Halobacterium salinarum]